jgi:O-antigen/teichoic acid export membrane protein
MSFALATAGACSLSAFIWPRIDIFVGMQLIVAVVWIFVWAGLARKSLGGLGLEGEPLKPHLSEVRAYSNWQMVNSFFGVAAGVADRYLIGGLMSTATLGAYNVALRVQTAARMSYFGLNQALFPAASAAISQTGAAERLTVEYTWRLMTTAAVAVGFAFVVAPSFLVLWVGPEVAKIAGWSLRWLLVAVVLEIPSATCSSYLFARALNRSQALINGLSTVVTLSAMVVFGKLFGLSGVASSGAISLVLTRIPFHIWVHKQHFHGILSRAEFTTVFYGLAGVVLALAVPIGLAFDHVFLLWVNYWGFAIGAAAFGILYAIATYGAFCLWPENRRRFKKIITEFRNRLCDSVILRRTATQNS